MKWSGEQLAAWGDPCPLDDVAQAVTDEADAIVAAQLAYDRRRWSIAAAARWLDVAHQAPPSGPGLHDVDAITALRTAIACAEVAMRSAITDARAAGATWDTIGARFGITRQLASKRYGP